MFGLALGAMITGPFIDTFCTVISPHSTVPEKCKRTGHQSPLRSLVFPALANMPIKSCRVCHEKEQT